MTPSGQTISRGIAIVQYASVEDAGRALKNLVFEESLGDPSRVKIEFYESRESRNLPEPALHDLHVTQGFAEPILMALKE